MDDLDIIPRSEAEFVLAASRSNFERFCERHNLRPIAIPGAGVIFRRSQFVAAVREDLNALNGGDAR
jgi:hypothetical protein